MIVKSAYDIALESMGASSNKKPKASNNGYMYLCPAHGDKGSFSGWIADNEKTPGGIPGLKCFADCSKREIIAALRAKGLWFWDDDKKKKDQDVDDEKLQRRLFKSWYYTNYEGHDMLRVSRYHLYTPEGRFVRKNIIQKKPDGKGGWLNPGKNYAVPVLNWRGLRAKAADHRVVFSVEGEKKVDLLFDWELCGFTHQGGAGNMWNFINSGVEKDCQGVNYVVIIPDLDEPGMMCALTKARHLTQHGIKVKLLSLPGLAELARNKGEGLDDWITQGHTKEELLQLSSACEFWQPEAGDELAIEPERIEIEPNIVTKLPANDAPLIGGRKLPFDDDPMNFLFTDRGNALWFKHIYKDTVAYLSEVKTAGWQIYSHGIWRYDNAKRVSQLMAKSVDHMTKTLLDTGYDFKKVREWREKSMMTRGLNAALTLAQTELAVDDTDFNQCKWLLPVLNGVIDLKTGELLDHSPHYKWTKCVDIEYNEELGFDDAPNAVSFLREIFPDPDFDNQTRKIKSVIRCFAISLTGDPFLRKWFLLWGPMGREGKSTIAEFILSIVGKKRFGVTVRKFLITEILNDSKFSDPGVLKEYRYALMDEIGKSDKIDNEKMKSVTGNDSITGSKLFENIFTFDPTHILYVYGNSKPRFDTGGDTAAQDRCVVIPFLRHFEEHEADTDMPEKLKAERQAFLTILVGACVEIWAAKDLMLHPMMINAKNDYMKEEDHFGRFLEQCTEKAEGATLSAEELYAVLVWWSKHEEGFKNVMAKNTMGKELKKRKIESKPDTTGYTNYQDIQITDACKRRQRFQSNNQQRIAEFN